VAGLRCLPADVTVVCSHDPVEFASVRAPHGVDDAGGVAQPTSGAMALAPESAPVTRTECFPAR
jgi:hypothetical protein